MLKYLIFACIVAVVASQQPPGDLDNILKSIFGGLNKNKTGSFIIPRTMNKPNDDCDIDGKPGKCVKPPRCSQELPTRDPATLFTYRNSDCGYLLQCCPLDQIRQNPKPSNTLPAGCGWTNPGGYKLRILDSNPTGFSDFADFPWMVALLTKSYGQTWSPQDYLGGGVLIHPTVVLTVAHKVSSKKPDELKCRAGEWDFMIQDEIYEHQDREVQRIITHHQFLLLHAHNDAALLVLTSPFTLKGVYHIGVACLARDIPAPGTLCYSMGWGSSFNDTNNTNLLKKIQLPMVDHVTCQGQLRNTRLGTNFSLHETLTCAGGEAGKDTCIGDGGSPLVCPVQIDNSMTRYAVYGLVSYGVSCGEKNVPGVYANVPSLIGWIDQEMQGLQLGTSSYIIKKTN